MLPLAAVHAAPTTIESEPAATLEVRTIDDARVDIDGATYEGAPVEVEVPAGEHRIEVTAPGYHPWRATVKLGSGSHVTMTTDLLSMDSAAIRLTTSGASVLMTTRSTADASSLLPSPPRAKSDVFLATSASLPLSAGPRADALLTEPARVDPDVFMVSPVQTGANPFMPPHRVRVLPSVFLPGSAGAAAPRGEPVGLMPVKRADAEGPAFLPAKAREVEPDSFMSTTQAAVEPSELLPTAEQREADVFMPTR